MRLLYEDDRLWAVDKPAGQNVIPGRGAGGPCLRDAWAARTGQKVFVVHRLDRDTSGIVLFAKTADAHRGLCRAFESRAVEKDYLAVVGGGVSPEPGLIRAPLREFGSGRTAVDPRGKDSETAYTVLATGATASLLRVRPRTGRRHQIRAHLCHRGHPVLGDRLYGPPPRPVGGAARLMLHAERLRWPGGALEVRCPPPPDFQEILRIVGLDEKKYLGISP